MNPGRSHGTATNAVSPAAQKKGTTLAAFRSRLRPAIRPLEFAEREWAAACTACRLPFRQGKLQVRANGLSVLRAEIPIDRSMKTVHKGGLRPPAQEVGGECIVSDAVHWPGRHFRPEEDFSRLTGVA